MWLTAYANDYLKSDGAEAVREAMAEHATDVELVARLSRVHLADVVNDGGLHLALARASACSMTPA
jgi:hypothetical protein